MPKDLWAQKNMKATENGPHRIQTSLDLIRTILNQLRLLALLQLFEHCLQNFDQRVIELGRARNQVQEVVVDDGILQAI